MLTTDGNHRAKLPQTSNIHQVSRSAEQEMSHRLQCTRDRRNALANTASVLTNDQTLFQTQSYHRLAERVRELEKAISPDFRSSYVQPAYSALTPCSNISGSTGSNYSRPYSFPRGLVSPNLSVPTQPFGLSSKVLERAQEIPERFWINWQEKQMQHRLDELESIKNNLTSSNEGDLATTNRRKSLLLLHNTHHRVNHSQSSIPYETVSTSIDTETSSSSADDLSLFNFDQRSIDTANNWHTPSRTEPITSVSSIRKSLTTFDRSQLTIFLPYSYKNTLSPTQAIPNGNYDQPFDQPSSEKTDDTNDSFISAPSSASSIEDVANIDTELNLTLLLQEKSDQTNPLLYSKAVMNRTIEFRSLSRRNE